MDGKSRVRVLDKNGIPTCMQGRKKSCAGYVQGTVMMHLYTRTKKVMCVQGGEGNIFRLHMAAGTEKVVCSLCAKITV